MESDVDRKRMAIYLKCLEDDVPRISESYPTSAAFTTVFMLRAAALLRLVEKPDRLWLCKRLNEMLWWNGKDALIITSGSKVVVLSDETDLAQRLIQAEPLATLTYTDVPPDPAISARDSAP
jgi:hypothetical protein